MLFREQKIKRTVTVALCLLLVCAVIVTSVLVFTDVLKTDQIAEAAAIRQGNTGTTVKNIQTKLKNWGYYSGGVDGIFGSQTTLAVKKFQRANKLTADGIVGTRTAAAMGISLSTTTTNNSSNLYLLARLVYGEARGEPYVGQVAVAAVVLNRVKSSQFPNTISGVIYQRAAFTCVDDGQINLSPNDTARRAAQDALNGWDPSNGCLYYYNPKTATNAWIRQKEIHLSIGRHVFCL